MPTQTLQSLGGIPAEFPPSWVMSQRYIQTLATAGALPWMLPLLVDDEATLRGMYDRLDALFLPGGADIDPLSYGAERHPKCDVRTDRSRDRLELTFVRWAMEEGKPVLGVCRGLQIINLAAGGTLWQDLADERPGAAKHDYFPFDGQFARDHLAHAARLAPSSRLREILGCDELPVNSMHHQAIRTLGQGLVATATAPDGVIEAAEGTGDAFLLGVQWHPEVLTECDPRMARLFAAFVEAGVEWREGARL
ncbi:MAG TPA: type 1 glutamine amidotransferase [Gemmatimonadaceae bacterium]|nr:type 1 glutamine amidotransferase [Gemmatimonadaceae bacterium]